MRSKELVVKWKNRASENDKRKEGWENKRIKKETIQEKKLNIWGNERKVVWKTNELK